VDDGDIIEFGGGCGKPKLEEEGTLGQEQSRTNHRTQRKQTQAQEWHKSRQDHG